MNKIILSSILLSAIGIVNIILGIFYFSTPRIPEYQENFNGMTHEELIEIITSEVPEGMLNHPWLLRRSTRTLPADPDSLPYPAQLSKVQLKQHGDPAQMLQPIGLGMLALGAIMMAYGILVKK